MKTNEIKGTLEATKEELVLTVGDEKYVFKSAGYIYPDRDEDGSLIVDRFQWEPNKPYAQYTEFVRFTLDNLPTSGGIYVWYIDGEEYPTYIGKADNLKERFSKSKYGKISQGCSQSTNIKMNHEVLKRAREGKFFHIYYMEIEDLESKLIHAFKDNLLNKVGTK